MNRIKDFILYSYISIREMPFFLKLITLFCLCGIFFIFGAIIPIGNYTIKNRKVTFIEFWTGGGGIIFLITGFILLASGIGFIKRGNWARILFLLMFPIQLFIIFLMDSIPIVDLQEAVFSYVILFLPIVGGYLFFKRSVKEYFGY